MPGKYLLGAIPCIDGRLLLINPSGLTSGDTSLSAKLAYLLPSASPTLARPSGGIYMGEEISPVPAKLVERIRQGEYVDKGELLPEFRKEEVVRETRPCRAQQVADIFTWLQSFAHMWWYGEQRHQS